MADKKTYKNKSKSASTLRAEAEEKLGQAAGVFPEEKGKTPDELIHELRVHQVELEMQNDELKKAQLVLEETQEKYRDLYDFSPVGYFTFVPGGLIKDVNLSGASLLGVERRKLINHGFGRFVEGKDLVQWDRHIMDVLEQGKKMICEIPLKRDDGSVFYARLESIRMEASGGTPVVRTTVSDITGYRKLEEQYLQAQKMEAVGQLAGGVAHDFNNVLTAIMGYASLVLMNMAQDDPQRQNIDTILEGAGRAAHLTKDLLMFSRKHVSDRMPLDLKDLVGKTEKFLRRVIREDIECKTIFAEEGQGRMMVLADSHQIEQVLMNLATNARDAMPKGGTFTISAEPVDLKQDMVRAYDFGSPGPYVMITVSDTGKGMDEETLQRIFEPFFTTKEVGKGTGLGLAVVYGIIKQHDGYISSCLTTSCRR